MHVANSHPVPLFLILDMSLNIVHLKANLREVRNMSFLIRAFPVVGVCLRGCWQARLSPCCDMGTDARVLCRRDRVPKGILWSLSWVSHRRVLIMPGASYLACHYDFNACNKLLYTAQCEIDKMFIQQTRGLI